LGPRRAALPCLDAPVPSPPASPPSSLATGSASAQSTHPLIGADDIQPLAPLPLNPLSSLFSVAHGLFGRSSAPTARRSFAGAGEMPGEGWWVPWHTGEALGVGCPGKCFPSPLGIPAPSFLLEGSFKRPALAHAPCRR